MNRSVLLIVAALLAANATYEKPVAAQTSASQKATANTQAKINRLPPAVKATVEAESKGRTIRGVSSEKENGETVYELETLVDGRTRDLMINSAGAVYLVEEQLDVDKAPAPVKAALEARGKILILESVTKGGKTTYEAQVQKKAGKKVAIELDGNGKPIAP